MPSSVGHLRRIRNRPGRRRGDAPGRTRRWYAARSTLDEFLRRRPALYEADSEGLADLYKQMFLAEYGKQRRDETY